MSDNIIQGHIRFPGILHNLGDTLKTYTYTDKT